MHRMTSSPLLALALAAAAPAQPARAQQDSIALRADLLQDLGVLQRKVVSLAQAMAPEQYGWTPMAGVRTVAQVYLHIAATNYFFPTMVGVAPPPASAVTSDYHSAEAFEAAGGTKEQIVAKLTDSFRHLRAALAQTSDFDRTVNLFGRPATVRQVWLEAITHIHEHLGQSIAYARANHVVPPWSR
jgi:uncharacterized damage-inducible protein DinB